MLRMEIALFLVVAFVAYMYFTAEKEHTALHKTFLVLLVAVLFLLGFLIGRGHTGGGDDEEYDDEPPRTPAKPLIPEERHTARVPRLVPREESSDSEPAAIPDKTPAAPMTPATPAEEPATAERSAQDEPTQADEDEVRTMSLDDLLDDIHNM